MYSEIVLPNLGFGMEEGRLIAWLKKPGDSVRKGEAVAEIESDKTNVELEAVVDGVLESILIPADQVVPVGTVLARIRTGESAASMPPPPTALVKADTLAGEDKQRISPVAQRLARDHGLDLATVRGSGPDGRVTREDVQVLIDRRTNGKAKVLTAPAVRKLARDHNLDLHAIRGTGKEGRITRADVEALIKPIQTPIVTPPLQSIGEEAGGEVDRHEVPLGNMRQSIARRLTQSMQEMPHFYTSAELDFTDALAALPEDIGLNALILYLAIRALKSQPELNATYDNGHLYHYQHVHLAMAVALPDGLMSPVLKNADDYSLSGLAQRSRDIIKRTRAGKLRVDELNGGTFTVSNLGIVKQIDRFTAIINPPQVAILAIGAAKPRPVVMNGGLHIRTTAHLTLSADHRIVDGLVAARFLEAFDSELQGMTTI